MIEKSVLRAADCTDLRGDLEIIEDIDDLASVVVPVSGGGLVAGIAA